MKMDRQMDRHGNENTWFSCSRFNTTGGKLFAQINLPFTTKQYKNDNIVNFVWLGENSTARQKKSNGVFSN